MPAAHPRGRRRGPVGAADRHQGVGRLTGLADRDDQRVPGQDRVAVAELGGELDLARDPGPVLDGVLRDLCCVVAGATRHDEDLVDVAQLVLREPHLVQGQVPLGRGASPQRLLDRGRLFVDLLQHEVGEPRLLGLFEIPVDVADRRLDLAASEVGDPELKCYLPGVPRATYQPYPFQILQGTDKILIAYTFSYATRTVYMDKGPEPLPDSWMGHSVGRWDGDTFVVQAGPEFKLLGKNTLNEMSLSTPAIARGSLILRTQSKLYRIAKRIR